MAWHGRALVGFALILSSVALLIQPTWRAFSTVFARPSLRQRVPRVPSVSASERQTHRGRGFVDSQLRSRRCAHLERLESELKRYAGKAAVLEQATEAPVGAAPAGRIIRMLTMFLSNQYRPAHQGPLTSWKVESREEQPRHRATLRIEPTKQIVIGRWSASVDDAKADAALLAVDERRGALRASSRAVLGETLQWMLRRPLEADDLEILTQEATAPNTGYVTKLRLFPSLQGEGDEKIPVMVFEGEGADKKESVHSASSQALKYLLTTLSCAPLVGIVLRLARGRGDSADDGIKTLRFWNAGTAEQEEKLRSLFAEYGELVDFNFARKEDGTPEGRGTVTYSTLLSSFAAVRRLRGEPVGTLGGGAARLLCVSVDKNAKRGNFKPFVIKGSGARNGVKETRVFFKNAALNLTPGVILDKFEEVAPVSTLFYWRQKKTGGFRGMGTVGYADPEDARRAIETLDGTYLGEGGTPLALSEYLRDNGSDGAGNEDMGDSSD